MSTKEQRVHAIVNAGPYPGMSEAFDAHMGAACWTDPAYAPDASMWAAAWKAAQAAPAVPAPNEPTDSMGMPISCGKPLCSPGDHHPLCKMAPAVPAAPVPAPLTECRDNDSPWLVCKPCAAMGQCTFQQPDGTLHDDGYFTWAPGRRPKDRDDVAGWRRSFYLAPTAGATAAPAAPAAPVQALSEAAISEIQRRHNAVYHAGDIFSPQDFARNVEQACAAAWGVKLAADKGGA